SVSFTFKARLQDGRTKTPGEVRFEPPPQVRELEARQLLPEYLGKRPNGQRYERFQPRGEVADALPQSDLVIEAQFNKPVVKAWLIPIERGPGVKEVDRERRPADAIAEDGTAAGWRLPTSPKLIAYRIELEDARGFTSPAPARRGVRMLPDAPPVVELLPEFVRDPDPNGPDARGSWEDYRFDMPLAPNGRVLVAYTAHSPMGVSRANLRYRVIPKGEQVNRSGDDVKVPQHPRDDPNAETFRRHVLKRVTPDLEK